MLKVALRLIAGWTPAVAKNRTDGFVSALTTCRLQDRTVLARALSVSNIYLYFDENFLFSLVRLRKCGASA